MKNENDAPKRDMQKENEMNQGEDRGQKQWAYHPKTIDEQLFINTVGPDLSIPGLNNAKKNTNYSHDQPPYKPSNTFEQQQSMPLYGHHHQVAGNAQWQQYSNVQWMTPCCCCHPYYGHYLDHYKY